MVLRRMELAPQIRLVFLLVPISTETDQPLSLQLVADRWEVVPHSDRTLAEALDACRIGLLGDICRN